MSHLRTIISALAASLVLTAFCMGQNTGPKSKRVMANTSKEYVSPLSKQVQDQLVSRERDLFAAQQRRNLAAVEEELAEDFREIGSGVKLYTKAEVLALLKDMQMIDHSLSDFRVLPLDNSSALVTYVANITRRAGGQETTTRSHRSSFWLRRHGSWRIVFHQSTPLPE